MDRKRRVSLSPSQRRSVYEMHLAGEPVRDIMAAFDISQTTAYKILQEERGEADMARSESVVAGNKKYGRLVYTGGDTYKGTCLVGNGARSREFKASNSTAAKEQWAQWCQELRDSESAFLANCEPRPKEVEQPEQPKEDEQPEEAPTSRVYLLWVNGEKPMFYGVYQSMTDAFGEMDRLNEVAKFLGSASTFEVEEVEQR